MKQKICPICDGKLKGNYCPFCHKIVRKPLEWDVRYYLNERHPDWETTCDYHSEPQVLEQAEGAGSASAFGMSGDQETIFQSAQPDIESDNPYKRSSKRAAPKINVSSTEKPKKKGRVGKIVLTVVGIWVILNIIMAVIANIDYEKIPESLASEEACENAIEIPIPDFTEDTGIIISEEEWNYEEGVKELSDEEVKERREKGLGDRCDTYFHFPVSYEAFAGKVEDYLANTGLSIDSYDEYTVNLLYSYGEEAEKFSSYNRTMEWYVLEPGMEETDYWSGVSLSSDTASGEIHWFEVALEDREQAFQMTAWAAETIGELAGFSNAKETAEQIYTELSKFEGEEEFWYADISEYSVSVWEYEGKTEVRLELSYDFAQKLSLD